MIFPALLQKSDFRSCLLPDMHIVGQHSSRVVRAFLSTRLINVQLCGASGSKRDVVAVDAAAAALRNWLYHRRRPSSGRQACRPAGPACTFNGTVIELFALAA